MIRYLERPEKTNQVINTFSNNVTSGKLNTLKNITQQQYITFNSKDRNTPVVSCSTDFQFSLPNEIKKVLSMKLVNIDFPKLAYYLFSDCLNNNVFWIKFSFCEESFEIRIKEGNYYTPEDLEEYLNHTYFCFSSCCKNPYLQALKFSIDKRTYQCTLGSSDPGLIFSVTFATETQDITGTLGWMLGFVAPKYRCKSCIKSETIMKLFVEPRSVFLSINDYQYNNNNNNLVILEQNMLDDFIIAKYNILDEQSLITFPRIYNGPVSLKKMGIKLYDENGHVIDLHGANVSFTLELTLLYENFNFSIQVD
jgi:hypothetical protein